jgi:hypothetical protein
MTELLIRDERLTARLRALAQQEGRSVEAVLEALLALYPAQATPPAAQPDKSTAQGVRRKAYARARRYWESVGDTAKTALTDDELDEQFWLIDPDGIPRLKSEQVTIILPPDPLVAMAEAAERLNLRSGRRDISAHFREVVGDLMADELRQRCERQHGK